MDSVDNLNFRRDSSTKFKLKLDNSIVKLTTVEPVDETHNKTLSANTAVDEIQLGKRIAIQKPPISDSRSPPNEEERYLEYASGYNTRLIAQRESLQFDKTFGLEGLYDLASTQLKAMQTSVPVVLKCGTGQTFYVSNNKMEPKKSTAEDFLKMNVHHQNMLFDTEKGGIGNFAPRRRRRGTLKGFKNAKL